MTLKEIVTDYIRTHPMDDSDAALLMEQVERATKVSCWNCKYMAYLPMCKKNYALIPGSETCERGARRD